MPPQDDSTNDEPKPIKVLIVEDDMQIQQMYATMFTIRRYTVVVAGDGEEGLVKTRAERPDVILLDIMMPKMNGIEMLENLKRAPDTKEIPVIMLSNVADDEHVDEALSKGAEKYIIKSEYVPRQVAEVVDQVVEQSRQAPPEPSVS